MIIIDAHTHLWLKQNAWVNNKKVYSLDNGKSFFLGETVQMLPPYFINSQNKAEILLSNMDYAQVSCAVVTQEFIDGMQNIYLHRVMKRYPDRLFVCGLCNFCQRGYFIQAKRLIKKGFKGIAIPAHRLNLSSGRVPLNSIEMMHMYALMEKEGIILSIALEEGDIQIGEMLEIIQQFPQLKIAIAHFGMVNRPKWIKQIKLAQYPQVYIESGGITWLFHKEFYPYPSAIKAIRTAADLVGIDKLMWGSDYPRTMTAITYKMSYDFISKSNLLNEEEKALFLGLNAQKFYGFNNLKELPHIKNMVE